MDTGIKKTLHGAKIVLIYTRQLTKDLVVSAMKGAGAGQVFSGAAPEMIQRLADIKPNFIVSEYDMEPLDGGMVLQYIRKHPEFAHIPCLMLVHERDTAALEKARQAGAQEVVKVPFTVDTLVKSAVKVLNGRQKSSATDLLFR